MTGLQGVLLVVVAILAPAVVLTRDTVRQAMVLGIYGFALAALFFALQAPDVALAVVVISTVALPIIVLLAIVKIREAAQEQDREP